MYILIYYKLKYLSFRLGSFIDCSLSLTRLCFDGSGFIPCIILSIGWLYPVTVTDTTFLSLRVFEKLIESIVFLFFCFFLPPYCLLYSIPNSSHLLLRRRECWHLLCSTAVRNTSLHNLRCNKLGLPWLDSVGIYLHNYSFPFSYCCQSL